VNQSWQTDFALARLNRDGSLDTTFGVNGLVTTPLGGNARINSVKVQSDGRIVAGGVANGGFLTLARYLPSGVLDRTFSGDGVVSLVTANSTSSTLNDIAILPDGRILAVGDFIPASIGAYSSTLLIARLNANGSFDSTFGVNGRVVDSQNVQRTGNRVEVFGDGTFLVAGNATTNRANQISSRMAVSKYDAAGTNLSSVIAEPFEAESFDPYVTQQHSTTLSSMVVQPNGRILLAGMADGKLAILKLNPDGTADTSYNGDGRTLTSLDGKYSSADLLRLPNGTVMAVGSLRSRYSTNSDFVLSRFLDPPRGPVSTSVFINNSGNVEIADLWSRDDRLRIQRLGNMIEVTDLTVDSNAVFTVTGIPGISGNGTKTILIPVSTILQTNKPLLLNTRAGDDTVILEGDNAAANAMNILFVGGAGTDRLIQNSVVVNATWVINGAGSGSVTLAGHEPRQFRNVEQFTGGLAADDFRIIASTTSVVLRLHGGDGVPDTLRVTADADISLSPSRFEVTGAISQQALIRGFENAILTGGVSDNILNAAAFTGNVSLYGLAGNDVLYGGNGNDQLFGGAGNDQLFGSYGEDFLSGGLGNDLLSGDYGDDTLHGDAGHDILVGGDGADVLRGGAGEDILISGQSPVLHLGSLPTDRAVILAAWGSADFYAARVAVLSTTGAGPSGRKLTPNDTVFRDFSMDQLFGGTGLDWFFAVDSTSAGGDLVNDRTLDEVLTPLL
jgi:uncharacterized delta-60 repeat protein